MGGQHAKDGTLGGLVAGWQLWLWNDWRCCSVAAGRVVAGNIWSRLVALLAGLIAPASAVHGRMDLMRWPL